MDGWNWALTLLGGGTLGGLAAIIVALKDRKKIKAEASDREIKTPAELDQLVATTRGVEIDNILRVQSFIVSENQRISAENKEIRTEIGGMRERVNIVERISREAHEFITHLLDLFEQHAPGVKVGKLPFGYKRPDHQ